MPMLAVMLRSCSSIEWGAASESSILSALTIASCACASVGKEDHKLIATVSADGVRAAHAGE